MNKRIIAAITLAAMSLSPLTALAYDESGVTSYLENCVNDYGTVADAEDKNIEILTALQDDYECTEEEAQSFYEDLLKKIAEKNKEDNDNQGENGENNANDSKPEDKPDEKTLKKGTESKMQVLNQLGIIQDSEFDYFGTVSRAKFSEYMANLINYGGDYSEEEGHYKFHDVTSDMECYHAVASLINKGAVIGVGGGIFSPDSDITVGWACGIMVRILGYDFIKTQYDDKGEAYYISKASEKKLLKGISAVGNSVVNGEDAVILLYNMLDADSVVMTDFREVNDTTSYMLNEMNLDYSDGIVTANSKTSLYSQSGAVAESYLKIGDDNYVFGDIMTVSELDALLGKKVRVFYDKDDTVYAKAIMELDDYNETFTLLSGNIEKYDDSLNRLYYTEDESSKEKYIEIPKTANIVFNGVAVDYEHIKKQLLIPDSGEITFISNDRKSGYEVVSIKSYVYYKVGVINTTDPKLFDEFTIQPNIQLDDESVTITNGGVESSYADLSKDMLLMVAPSRVVFKDGVMYADTDNSTYISIEIMSVSVTGKVNGSKSGNEGIKIGDEIYELSETFKKLNEKFPDMVDFKLPPTGSNVSASLDKYNKIVSFTVNTYAEGLKYGYIVKLIQDADSDEYFAKIFTQENEMLKLGLADKVSVHKKWNEGKLSTSTYFAKKLTKEKLAVMDGGSFNAKPVKFTVNADNKINELYIADGSNTKTAYNQIEKDLDFFIDKSIFMKNFSNVGGSGIYGYNVGYWYNVANNNINGVYLIIPSDTSADDDQYKAYEGIYSTSLPGGTWNNIEFYDVNSTGTVGLLIRYVTDEGGNSGKKEETGTAVVMEEPELHYDSVKDEITYSIKLYANIQAARTWRIGKEQEFTFENSDLVSYTISKSSSETISAQAQYSNIPIEELKPGDIILVSKSKESGKINGFCLLARNLGDINPETGKPEMSCTYVNPSPLATEMLKRTGPSQWQEMCVTKGIVEKSIDSRVFFVNDGSEYYRKLTIGNNTYTKDKVVILDKKASKNPVTEGAFSDIRVGDYVVSAFDETLVIVRNYN